ncbi:MAG: hypothetical protein AB7E04_12895 [Desulfobacteraceae bacterium]
MKAAIWKWKETQPGKDEKGRPIPYKLEENGQIKWKCSHCYGIYFMILEDKTLACFSCKKPLYSGKK